MRNLPVGHEESNLFVGWNHDFDASGIFVDAISCFLCNSSGPDFRECMYNDTLAAWDTGMGVNGLPLKGSIVQPLGVTSYQRAWSSADTGWTPNNVFFITLNWSDENSICIMNSKIIYALLSFVERPRLTARSHILQTVFKNQHPIM